MGAVRLPKIAVMTIDDFVSAQKCSSSKDEDETAELAIFDGKLTSNERALLDGDRSGEAILAQTETAATLRTSNSMVLEVVGYPAGTTHNIEFELQAAVSV